MIDGDQLQQERFEITQRNHVGPVGRRPVGVLVGFDEDAGDAHRDCGAAQHRHEFPLAALTGIGSTPVDLTKVVP